MSKREILFRGKRIDNGEWVEGSLITGVFVRGGQEIPYILCPDQADYDCFEDFSEENGIFEVASETVCQYTGLTDKNGRKIFEGDICIVDGLIYKVSFKNSHWNFDIIFENVYCNPWFDSHCGEHCEVIGNIFDNPELLN